MRTWNAAYATVLLAASFLAHADVAPDQWQSRPGLSTAELVKKLEGKVVSTDAIAWPDGRSALIVYVLAKDRLYRCTDFMTADYQENGYSCAELTEVKK